MAEEVSSEFYWDNIIVKVEDRLFCVPRCEFVQSSEVFADMFCLPSGSAAPREGQDREHPIVLEGYKKDEFSCLLKVMYPRAGSLIFGTTLDLSLKKEEWVSVLKLSTIWNMTKIRRYAIHRLSTDVVVSPVEKILLARAHKVAAWLDEGITSLVLQDSDPRPTLEDLATLGWETAARILWIRDNSSPSLHVPNALCFRRDAIKCSFCSSSSSLIGGSHNCHSCMKAMPADAQLTVPGPGFPSGTGDRVVSLRAIQCHRQCGGYPFLPISVRCSSCSRDTSTFHNSNVQVRITPNQGSKEMIKEMFGEEIIEECYDPSATTSVSLSLYFD